MYDVIKEGDFVRNLCSTIHALRKVAGIPVSQPLKSATFFKSEEFDWFILSPNKRIIQEECNLEVVDWDYIIPSDYSDHGISTESRLNFREAGKLLGKNTQRVASLVSSGEYVVELGRDTVNVDGLSIPGHLVELRTSIDIAGNAEKGVAVAKVGNNSFVSLDTTIYPHLYIQKLSNELIKAINAKRREENLAVGDFIFLSMELSGEYLQAFLGSCTEVTIATKTQSIELRKLKTEESGFNIKSVHRIF